jgi:PAS domain S-box-containing protein
VGNKEKPAGKIIRPDAEFYDLLFENSLDGIALADAETGVLVDCNRAFERLSGWQKEYLIGQPQYILHPEEERVGNFSRSFTQHRLKKRGKILKSRLLTKSGSIKDVEISGGRVKIDERELVYGFFHDVTELERADAQLNESEARLQTILENIPFEFWVCDETGKYILQNRFSYKNWGMQIGKRPEDMNIAPETLRIWQENNRRALSGEVVRGEETIQMGVTTRTVENILAPIYLGGKVNGFLGVNIDITDRKRAEEERNLLFNNSIDLQAVVGMDGCFKQLNPAWEKALGWSLHEMLGKPYMEFVHPDDLEKTAVIETSLASGKPLTGFENRYRTKSGNYKWLSWNAGLLGVGNSPIFLAVARDISEQKRLQLTIDSIESGLAEKFGTNFFEAMVLEISEILGSDYALIGKLTEDQQSVRTIAMCVDGQIVENIEYGLENTPCAGALSFMACSYPQDVIKIFPQDQMLRDLNVEGYTGIPLVDTNGNAQGIMVALYRQPIPDPGLVHSVMKIFAVRVVAEMARQQAQEELRISEARYRSLFDNSPVSLWEEDFSEVKRFIDEIKRQGVEDIRAYFSEHPDRARECAGRVRIVDINQTGISLFEMGSYVPSDFEIKQYFSESTLPTFIDEVVALAAGNLTFQTEIETLNMDHQKIYNIMRLVVMPGHEQDWGRIQISFVDLTMRKRAEDNLRQSESKLRLLFEKMLTAFALHEIILNEAGEPVDYRYLEINPAFENITGAKASDLVGHTVLERMPNTEKYWIETFGRVALSGEPASFSNFSRELGKYYEGIAFSPLPGQFAVMFNDVTERVLAELSVRRSFEQQAALREIDQAILGGLELPVVCEIILKKVVHQLNVDAAEVLRFDPDTHSLQILANQGVQAYHGNTFFPLQGDISTRAVLDRQTLDVSDFQEYLKAYPSCKKLEGEHFQHFVALPLVAKGSVKGVLEIFSRSPLELNQEWWSWADAFAGQAALALDNQMLFQDLQHSNFELTMAYDLTLEGWSKALELRDRETEGHSHRVTDLTVQLAAAMNIPRNQLIHYRRGALLHDIGKMGVPDNVLNKPGKLTPEEWDIIRHHPVTAYEMLVNIPFLRPALDIPYYHHERWDGSGYPHGLKAEEIPLAARIFAVVDVWDALTSDRPYRGAMSDEWTFNYLRENSAVLFDPQVVEMFIQLISNQKRSSQP